MWYLPQKITIVSNMQELKTKIVTYGWEGNEREATEFPLDVAKHGFGLCVKVLEMGEKALQGSLNLPSMEMLLHYCLDVIENGNNGEITYVLSPFLAMQFKEIKQLEKFLNH
jgi:hypothetical protein